jgi:hypothetical protein
VLLRREETAETATALTYIIQKERERERFTIRQGKGIWAYSIDIVCPHIYVDTLSNSLSEPVVIDVLLGISRD